MAQSTKRMERDPVGDPADSPFGWWEKGTLGILGVFTAAAVLGYGIFALHPQFLPEAGFGLTLYTVSFGLFARLHIALAAVAMAIVLTLRLGLRWVPAFVAVYALSFLAEHVGTGFGFPFGGYEYTALLGPKLLGRVPWLIPVSWFLMALPAWLIARRTLVRRQDALARVAVGSLWLVAWDLALDPAMSALTPYWVWEEPGPYYGMPWINLLGWYVTGLALLTAIEFSSRSVRFESVDFRWTVGYYAAMLLMPLGMLLAAGEWLAVAATALGLAACRAATVWADGRSRVPDGERAPDGLGVRA